jgi:alkylresorcinol/alkylpyrone synthase
VNPEGPSVALLSLATAVPDFTLDQQEAKALAREMFGVRAAFFERLEPVFDNAGIDRRDMVRPVAWYREEHGWKDRNQVYLEAAEALYIAAATKALAEAGLLGGDVDALVTVSTTGIATPSIEARVAGRMGFRPDAERVPVFGLGCAGGVSGLALASRIARSGRGRTVLYVTIELCSTSVRLDKLTKANIVASALFADGAAAAVLRPGQGGIAAIGGGSEVLWPDTLGIMGWDVEDAGLGVIFDQAIPPFVAAHMADGVAAILERAGEDRGAIAGFVCHPGGAKVIAAIESSLALAEGTLAHERAVLRDHGNMSAPTVLFVLERALAAGLPGKSLMLALGPGFTTSGLIVDRAA